MTNHNNTTETSETTGSGGGGTRVDGAVSWIGWHVPELGAVTVPLGLAPVVSPWCALVSVVAGALWGAHDVRLARRNRAIRTETQRRQLAALSEPAAVETNGDGDEPAAREVGA
ncbi:hypothetical protein ABZ639_27030 [Saccharomonospora sp. NPDC006951]